MAKEFKTIVQTTINFELALYLKAEAEKLDISIPELVRRILQEHKNAQAS